MRFILFALLFSACTTRQAAVRSTLDQSPPLVLGVDTHLHLTMSHAARPLFSGEPGAGPVSHEPAQRLVNQVTEAQCHAAGVRLIWGAVWPPFRLRAGQSGLEIALSELRALDEFTLRHPGFAIAPDAIGARSIIASGRIAVFPQLEGGEGIAQAPDVDVLYAAGVRVITLVHFVSTPIGVAAHGQVERALLGAKPSGVVEEGGLSPLGFAVVRRMVDLGIAIDVAHGSDRLVADVLSVTEPLGVPIVVSHTAARALSNYERNLSDALARRIVASGGLIGVSLYDKQVETSGDLTPSPQSIPGTCDDVVAHWRHFARVVPPSSLVLGSDLNGFITRPAAGGQCPEGIRNAGDLPTVWRALSDGGVPRDALDGMGERTLRFLEAVEAHGSPSAQADARHRRSAARRQRSALAGVP